LPGGEETVPPGKLQELSGIDALTERRLIARHGSRALPLAEDMKRGALSSEVVCPCEPVTEAEIRATVRHEWARSVDDVARRTRLGLGPCGGKLCARRAGEIVAEELGLTPEAGEESAALFLRGNERRTACLKG
jgi:glycerol-3-phosphate dehydrogenase